MVPSKNIAQNVLVLLCFLMGPIAAIGEQPDKTTLTLKEAVGGRYQIGVGVKDNIPQREKDWALLTNQFVIVTPENSMKTQSVQPEEGVFRFGTCDRFVAFAEEKDLEIVGHCLIWAKDDRTASWWMTYEGQPTTKEKLLQRMKTHIDTVVGRYADKVSAWDVVNEALSDSGDVYLRDSIWSRTCGEEFIVKAFEYAKAKDPTALLIYNDYNCENPRKLKNTMRLLKSLKEQGAPVDALGIQGHFEIDAIKFADLEKLFQECQAIGIKVVVSELDIDVIPRGRWWADGGKYRDEMSKIDPYKDGCPPEILKRQADQYAQLFELFKKYESTIARISFWNLHDGESWLNYFPWERSNHPLLFDRSGQPKPAFYSVIDVLK
jgi:endo-1,4-beta-xylanase